RRAHQGRRLLPPRRAPQGRAGLRARSVHALLERLAGSQISAVSSGRGRPREEAMNVFKAMAVKDVAEATKAIPVIDFGPAFRGEPGGLDAVAAQVRRACESIGFFYLAGHGVDQAIVDAAFGASREFHAMPME